ncbi:MAG: hypothetical protein HOV83_41730 [Catenulispora sp.]|nr:hypothetical protein [Catenulispora sp.]
MNDEADAAAQTQAARWVFGGARVNAEGKRVHAWIDPAGEELYFKPRGSPAVGVVYEVVVSRPDGGRITRHGDPRYTGDRAEPEARDALSARHRAAEATLDLAARERRAKTDDPLEIAIERLRELAQTVKANQRTAFWAYVIARLTRPGSPPR